jgi:hypothetical protein
VGERLDLVVAVEVARRLGERRVRPAAEDHARFVGRHRLDEGAGVVTEGGARHASADGHHHVDDEI